MVCGAIAVAAPQTIHSMPVGPESCPHSTEPLAGVTAVHCTEPMDVAAFARVLGLEATLREQNGVIRRDQALAAGLTRHRIDNLVKQDRWVRVLPMPLALRWPSAS